MHGTAVHRHKQYMQQVCSVVYPLHSFAAYVLTTSTVGFRIY